MPAPPTPAERGTAPPPGQWPCIDEEMIEAAAEVLRSGKVNYWTGPNGRAFEAEFAESCGVEHGVAVSNGTAALEAALYALQIGVGDEVIVPSRTFIATASSVARMGATPVVADVDAESQNLTAETIEPVITRRTKAVIAVHLAGWPCGMDPINALARDRGLRVIEDCAQCHGAQYKGRPTGSLGDIAAYSFCQDKILTTAGEGGMVLTNDRQLWKRAWSYKDHGKNHDAVHDPNAAPGFRLVHHDFGTNARMTEVQAAVGRVALQRLPGWVESRRRNARILDHYLDDNPAVRVPQTPTDVLHSYYRYYAFLRRERLRDGWTRERLLDRLKDVGCKCFTGSCSEIYLERAFQGLYPRTVRLPTAKLLGETSLALLVHPTLAETEMHRTGQAIASALKEATRPEWLSGHGGPKLRQAA